MFQIGDRVKVRLVNIDKPVFGVVVAVIPGHVYREDMYRIRGEGEITGPTLTPTPNESWIDGWLCVRPNDWE